MRFLLPLLLALPLCALAEPESDFRAARDALRVGNLARLDKAAENLQNTPLEIYATSYQLRARLSTRATAPIKAFLARGDESPVVDQFRSDWLKFLARQESWETFAEEYPNVVNIDDELACYALQLRQQSDEAAALAEARKLWFRDDEMPESCTPLFRRGREQGIITDTDVWKRMRLALESGNVSFAKQLIKQLPKSEQFPAAELSVASSNPRRYLEKTKFENVGTGRRLTALFALLRLARQSREIAFARWEKIANYFTEEEQRYFFGWIGFAGAQSHDERALLWYAVAGDAALNPKQLAWRARAALRMQNWHEVWASINAMPPQQQSEGAWRYWKGRALVRLARPTEAEEVFAELSREYNYYGQLAAEELGKEAGPNIFSTGYRASEAEVEVVQQMPAIQRTLLLYRMDMRTEAAKEWAWATRKFNDRQLLAAAEVAQRNEMYDRSINAADRTVSVHDFNLRYPAPYRAALRENLDKHGLEEAWVYGLMRQESRFTTSAKSGAGAAGLMQIMPDTARWVARQMGMKSYRKGLIHQLDVNLKLGTYYMKTVFKQFDENPVLASAAYNAGPNRAKQWRDKKPLEGAVYIETIPFDETRDYVRKVMSNTIYYSMLFGQSSQSLKQRLGTIEAERRK
ncbi:MAG: transglycosylase [Sideroxydans sp. GWF2_59_14]|nr:MAG: transglycosylase [Sideroxydans sp. GWF2_59_14]HAF45503.1 transglycosylase [Gallionellaceae bacterium]